MFAGQKPGTLSLNVFVNCYVLSQNPNWLQGQIL